MLPTPTARRDGLIIRELEDETLVYDLESDEAHCLNQTAALVWKHCNGRLTVADIVERLQTELHEDVDPKIVRLALAQLNKRRLLSKSFGAPDSKITHASHAHISRRELAIGVGRALVIALPLITTLSAPTPASAGSCGNCGMPPTAECCGQGCPCQNGGICCSGVCSAGSCT